jgi:hypothetical protein
VCVLVDYPVSLRYRGGHPRTYIVGGGDGDLDTAGSDWSAWNSSFTTAVATSWAAFISGIEAITVGSTVMGTQCCVRYINAGAPLVAPIVLPLASFSVQTQLASQRRRIGRK